MQRKKIYTAFQTKELTKEQISFIKENLSTLKKEMLDWMAELKPDFQGEISLLFTGDKTSAELNETYRKKNKSTDVLSFALLEHLQDNTGWQEMDCAAALGDVVINLDQLQRQHDLWNNSLLDELRRLTVHGLLHLVGYDHERNSAANRLMKKIEEKLLNKERKGNL